MPYSNTYDLALLTANVLDDSDASAVGALYDNAGLLVPESVRSVDRVDPHLTKDPRWVHRPPAVIGTYNHNGYSAYVEEAILGGHIFAGWGHIITETLSTAWWASRAPAGIPLVMVPWGRLWVSSIHRIRETLDLAGWADRPVIAVSGSTVFGKVHVPERLIRFDELLYEQEQIPAEMNSVYDLMIQKSRSGVPGNKKPAFLARSRGHRRLHGQEMAVEEALAEAGFRVIEGWSMSVKDQIALVNTSSCLVGFSGSSLHNSVFADSGVPVVEVMDSRAHAPVRTETPLQVSLCALRDQPFARVAGYQGEEERHFTSIVADVVRALQ